MNLKNVQREMTRFLGGQRLIKDFVRASRPRTASRAMDGFTRAKALINLCPPKKRVISLCVLLLFLALPVTAHAFLRIRPTDMGFLIWDKTKPFRYNIYAPIAFTDVTHDALAGILSEKYAVWKDTLKNQIQYDYVGMTGQEITYVENTTAEVTDTDGIHTHRVVLEKWTSLKLSSSAVAITLLFNNKEDIYDADIVYNEEFYNFCVDIQTCRAGEVHLPSIILHEQGHQIGFDHSLMRPSIMQADTSYQTERNMEATDIAGALCAYAKDQVETADYVSACAQGEKEATLGNARSFLSSSPALTSTGCGSLGPPPPPASPPNTSLGLLLGLMILWVIGLRRRCVWL